MHVYVTPTYSAWRPEVTGCAARRTPYKHEQNWRVISGSFGVRAVPCVLSCTTKSPGLAARKDRNTRAFGEPFTGVYLTELYNLRDKEPHRVSSFVHRLARK